MSGHTHIHTHTHTHIHTYTHDNYYNPRCAHAHRGLITLTYSHNVSGYFQWHGTIQVGISDWNTFTTRSALLLSDSSLGI